MDKRQVRAWIIPIITLGIGELVAWIKSRLKQRRARRLLEERREADAKRAAELRLAAEILEAQKKKLKKPVPPVPPNPYDSER